MNPSFSPTEVLISWRLWWWWHISIVFYRCSHNLGDYLFLACLPKEIIAFIHWRSLWPYQNVTNDMTENWSKNTQNADCNNRQGAFFKNYYILYIFLFFTCVLLSSNCGRRKLCSFSMDKCISKIDAAAPWVFQSTHSSCQNLMPTNPQCKLNINRSVTDWELLRRRW